MRQLLEELFANYYGDVYRYLYSLSHDASLSEDLTSEVFLEVIKSIATFRNDSNIKTWLFSIARHRWYRYLRRMKRVPPMEELPEQLADMQLPLDAQYYNKQLAQEILRILDGEPERTRKIVRMRMDGYSFCEIGEKFGITENSARVIDFRAKAKIRNILRKEGFDDEGNQL